MNVTIHGVTYTVRSEADIPRLIQAVRLLETLRRAA